MRSYTVHDFNDWEDYALFIRFMIDKSDKFSLVYFKHTEDEKWLKPVENVYNTLKPYTVYEKNTTKWPGTITLNENNHIYNMVVYKSIPNVEDGYSKHLAYMHGTTQYYPWIYHFIEMDMRGLSCVHMKDGIELL